MATTTTVLASTYSGSTNLTLSNIANAYTNTSSTNYAQLTVSKKNATGEIDFGFDFSAIPANATIQSVTIKVKAMVSSTSYISSATVQAYKNGVAVGSATNYRTTTATTYTLSAGSWSRADLDGLTLHFDAKRSNTNNTAYSRVYGIEVIVVWEEPSEALYVKESGAWVQYSKAYKKVGGAWVEQTTLDGLCDENTQYIKG